MSLLRIVFLARFKLDSYVFLLERKEGGRSIRMLLSAERKYHDFFGLLKVHAIASEDSSSAVRCKVHTPAVCLTSRVPSCATSSRRAPEKSITSGIQKRSGDSVCNRQ
jgi:hypothetical protein